MGGLPFFHAMTLNADPQTSILTGHLHFDNELFDAQFLRALGKIYDRGADVGECFSTAFRIRDNDKESWYQEWDRTAEMVERAAEESQRKGRTISARDGFLRATEYHRTAEFFLRDDLDDPRILQTAESVKVLLPSGRGPFGCTFYRHRDPISGADPSWLLHPPRSDDRTSTDGGISRWL